jgi:hypothetical protein
MTIEDRFAKPLGVDYGQIIDAPPSPRETILRALRPSVLSVLILGISTVASAQDASKIAASKWRPTDGIYAVPGANFSARCRDQAEAYVRLADNLIAGNEYGCKIKKMTDTAPGQLKLEAACSDAQTETTKNELILLKRIDDRTFSWRHVTAGTKDPGIKFSYCPEDAQQTDRENEARSKAEAEQNSVPQKSQQKQ